MALVLGGHGVPLFRGAIDGPSSMIIPGLMWMKGCTVQNTLRHVYSFLLLCLSSTKLSSESYPLRQCQMVLTFLSKKIGHVNKPLRVHAFVSNLSFQFSSPHDDVTTSEPNGHNCPPSSS